MNKLTAAIFLSVTILVNTACTKADNMVDTKKLNKTKIATLTESKNSSTTTISIQVDSEDASKVIEVEYDKDSSIQDKVNLILDTISTECFTGLIMNSNIIENSIVEIELEEYEDESKKVSWNVDYLNENTKQETINLIVKNVLQENNKSDTYNINDVRIYYNEKLVTLD